MKNVVFVFCLFCLSILAYSQGDKYYYFYTPSQIEDNIKQNRHNTCQVLYLCMSDSTFWLGTAVEFGEDNITPTNIIAISGGKIEFLKDLLYCYDKRFKRTYKFKQIDFYTLEVLNHTAVFVKGTKIYLHLWNSGTGESFNAFFHPNDLIKSTYWQTGIKDGIFVYSSKREVVLRYYKNGILLDSVVSVSSDSITINREKTFLKKYYEIQ